MDETIDERIDRLHGPGAAAALNADIASGAIFETSRHNITMGCGYKPGEGEGIAAECPCGWRHFESDGGPKGAALSAIMASHDAYQIASR